MKIDDFFEMHLRLVFFYNKSIYRSRVFVCEQLFWPKKIKTLFKNNQLQTVKSDVIVLQTGDYSLLNIDNMTKRGATSNRNQMHEPLLHWDQNWKDINSINKFDPNRRKYVKTDTYLLIILALFYFVPQILPGYLFNAIFGISTLKTTDSRRKNQNKSKLKSKKKILVALIL